MDKQTTADKPAPQETKPEVEAAGTEQKQSSKVIETEWIAHRVELNKQTNREEVHLRALNRPHGQALDFQVEDPASFGLIRLGQKVRLTITPL